MCQFPSQLDKNYILAQESKSQYNYFHLRAIKIKFHDSSKLGKYFIIAGPEKGTKTGTGITHRKHNVPRRVMWLHLIASPRVVEISLLPIHNTILIRFLPGFH